MKSKPSPRRGNALSNKAGYLAVLIAVIAVGGAGTAAAPAPLSSNIIAKAETADRRPGNTPYERRVLKVGPGGKFAKPSEAAAVARTGDTIEIASGTYVDCAVWPGSAAVLTIESTGGMVVITGNSCENMALFVIRGDNVTVRGITFTGAAATRHNGAGIRAQGRNLTIQNSQFIDNEEGILAESNPKGRITVSDSVFKGNGNCIEACAHGIYVNQIAELRIERSRFVEQHAGHHVKSRAARTELTGNTIEDGPFGTASYLVDIPNGGALVMRDNTLEKGPHSENPSVAVTLGEEGATNLTPEIIIENNKFTNDMAVGTFFVRNRTATAVVLRGNRLIGSVKPSDGP